MLETRGTLATQDSGRMARQTCYKSIRVEEPLVRLTTYEVTPSMLAGSSSGTASAASD